MGGGSHRLGLLIDWGGVLTTNVFESFSAFCVQEGLSPDAVAQRFRSDRECRELLIGLETGTLGEAEFEPALAAALGVAAPGLIERLFALGSPDQPMRDAVARAREGGIRTGLISNSWGTSRYDRPLLEQLFDGIVLSGEVGVRKPTPRIYELGAEAIGLAPGECVFVDDLPFNLPPARELGMATVHHIDAQSTIDDLERLLSVDLR
ncbi:MAG: HAD family hydrolase [Solirubrobacteraceae bacterium]